jgi:2-polyprenyl-6-methoxyphenol hydroxylase-like FAD-dependent oxidoreductase
MSRNVGGSTVTPSAQSCDIDYDVAIVGYGPSGVTAANFLGQYGIKTVVLEKDAVVYTRARAVTVDDWTLRAYQAVGLDAELKLDMDPSGPCCGRRTRAGRSTGRRSRRPPLDTPARSRSINRRWRRRCARASSGFRTP